MAFERATAVDTTYEAVVRQDGVLEIREEGNPDGWLSSDCPVGVEP